MSEKVERPAEPKKGVANSPGQMRVIYPLWPRVLFWVVVGLLALAVLSAARQYGTTPRDTQQSDRK